MASRNFIVLGSVGLIAAGAAVATKDRRADEAPPAQLVATMAPVSPPRPFPSAAAPVAQPTPVATVPSALPPPPKTGDVPGLKTAAAPAAAQQPTLVPPVAAKVRPKVARVAPPKTPRRTVLATFSGTAMPAPRLSPAARRSPPSRIQ